MNHFALLIGLHNSGKTHYGGQLELRLSLAKGKLRKVAAESDASLFQSVKSNLSSGLSSTHTPTDTKRSKNLELIYDGSERFDLIWQDYDGEQVKRIVDRRKIDAFWQENVAGSDSWILFVRPVDIKLKKDPINQLPNRLIFQNTAPGETPDAFTYSDQTVFVELLQMLLFEKRVRLGERISCPRLTLVLSCWDELDFTNLGLIAKGDGTPRLVLQKIAPLLHSFVINNWKVDCCEIFGLSSLGMALDDSKPNKSFLSIGPENAGWVVLPDGSRSGDLTLPLVYALSSNL